MFWASWQEHFGYDSKHYDTPQFDVWLSKRKIRKKQKSNTRLVLTLGARQNNDNTLALIIQIIQNDSSKEAEPNTFELTT